MPVAAAADRYPARLLIVMIVSSFPIQYYLSLNYSADIGGRAAVANGVARYINGWRNWYGEMQEWLDEVLPPAQDQMQYLGDEDDAEDEGQIMKLQLQLDNGLTMKNISEEGWFASSTRPRTVRPNQVLFKVGQIVYNTLFGMHCVIIGWDKVLRAPNVWVELAYNAEDRDTFFGQPHYTVICDMRDSEALHAEFQYSAQSDLDPNLDEDRERILTTYLDNYFEGFDEQKGRYIMRPWLRKIYPKDF